MSEKSLHEIVRDSTQEIGEAVRGAIPPDTGFVLFVVSTERPGQAALVSNIKIDDVLLVIEAWVKHQHDRLFGSKQ